MLLKSTNKNLLKAFQTTTNNDKSNINNTKSTTKENKKPKYFSRFENHFG